MKKAFYRKELSTPKKLPMKKKVPVQRAIYGNSLFWILTAWMHVFLHVFFHTCPFFTDGTKREIEIENERKWKKRDRKTTEKIPTYGSYLYKGHGACQTWEGAAENGTSRTKPPPGWIRPFLCSCFPLYSTPANPPDADVPFIGVHISTRICVYVCVWVARASARLNLATCSFSMLDTLSLLPIPANSARSYDFFSSPRLSFSPSLHSLKAITSFSPFSPPFPLLFFLYTLFLLSNLANNKKLVQWPSRFSLSDSSSRFFLRDIEFQRIFPSVFSPRFLCFWIRERKFHYATRWSELFASIYLSCTSASSQILPRSSRWFFSLLD